MKKKADGRKSKLDVSGPWTRFMDMHSGGGQKEKWSKIYIQASEEEAKVIFYNKFGHDPDRVTCTCCGEDYSISEEKDLQQASGYDRGCNFKQNKYVEEPCKDRVDRFTSFKTFLQTRQYNDYGTLKEVLLVFKSDIKPSDREGEVHHSGYIWVD